MPSPQVFPALQTQRKILPLTIPAAESQSSMVCFTQSGTGTVRIWPPFPIKSTIAQWSSRRWRRSTVNWASSRRRSPQPSRMASRDLSRLPLRVSAAGDCQRRQASSAVSQFPSRTPSFRAPFTRRMPAASFEMNSVARHDGFIEGKAGLGTIPGDEFLNRVSVASLRLR